MSNEGACAEQRLRATPMRWWPLTLAGVVVTSMLAATMWFFHAPLFALFEAPAPKGAPQPPEAVSLNPSGLMCVSVGSALGKRLQVVPVAREKVEYPLLNATGYVMARLAPGSDQADSRWDFASPEIATAYGDWLNARADVLFLEKQAKKTHELVTIRVAFLKNEYERKKKFADVLPERDVVAAKADYLQADIQGQKDINEAETNFKKAERNRGLLEHQLFQAGVDPEMIRRTTEGLVLVVADVPEAKMELVKVGQACEARFFGVTDQVFKGRVGRLGPSVAKEKRTLRVTFELTIPSGRLLPGMFAEIGLGTESRNMLMVPADAVLHAGRSDFVLREETVGKYRAFEVKVDEPRLVAPNLSYIPVLGGLNEGDRVVGMGAILLKPLMVKSLGNSTN